MPPTDFADGEYHWKGNIELVNSIDPRFQRDVHLFPLALPAPPQSHPRTLWVCRGSAAAYVLHHKVCGGGLGDLRGSPQTTRADYYSNSPKEGARASGRTVSSGRNAPRPHREDNQTAMERNTTPFLKPFRMKHLFCDNTHRSSCVMDTHMRGNRRDFTSRSHRPFSIFKPVLLMLSFPFRAQRTCKFCWCVRGVLPTHAPK